MSFTYNGTNEVIDYGNLEDAIAKINGKYQPDPDVVEAKNTFYSSIDDTSSFKEKDEDGNIKINIQAMDKYVEDNKANMGDKADKVLSVIATLKKYHNKALEKKNSQSGGKRKKQSKSRRKNKKSRKSVKSRKSQKKRKSRKRMKTRKKRK